MKTQFEVRTWTETGFTEGFEDVDCIDDLDIALIWLRRNDCRDGSIKCDGELVATKEDFNEPIEFHNGWSYKGKEGE